MTVKLLMTCEAPTPGRPRRPTAAPTAATGRLRHARGRVGRTGSPALPRSRPRAACRAAPASRFPSAVGVNPSRLVAKLRRNGLEGFENRSFLVEPGSLTQRNRPNLWTLLPRGTLRPGFFSARIIRGVPKLFPVGFCPAPDFRHLISGMVPGCPLGPLLRQRAPLPRVIPRL